MRAELKEKLKHWMKLFLLLVVALDVRLLFAIPALREPKKAFLPDSFGYERLALNLLEHRTFSQSESPPLVPDSHRTIGYPLFIASIYAFAGRRPEIVLVVQCVLDAVIALTVYAIAALAFGKQAATIAALLYAIAPLPILQSQRLMSETLFIFIFLLSLWAWLKYMQHQRLPLMLASTLLLGLATHVRPIGIAMMALVCLFTLIFPNPKSQIPNPKPLVIGHWSLVIGHLTISLTVYAAALVPWLVRNFVLFKTPVLCTSHHLAFAYYNAAAALAEAESIPLEEAQTNLFNRALTHFAYRKGFEAKKPDDIWQPATQDPRNVRYISQEAWRIVRQHPKAFASVHLKGLIQYAFMSVPIRGGLATLFEVKLPPSPPPLRPRLLGELSQGRVASAVRIAWQERLSFLPPAAQAIWLFSLLFSVAVEFFALWGFIRAIRGKDAPLARPFALFAFLTVLVLLFPAAAQIEPRFRATAEPLLIALAAFKLMDMRLKRGGGTARAPRA